MGRIISAVLTALLVSAGLAPAREGEPEVQLYATAAEESAPPAAVRHTVSSGDTLWDISNRYYGDPFQWGSLYGANADKVRDPDRITPGQEIVVPELTGSAPGAKSAAGPDPAPADSAVPASVLPAGVVTGQAAGGLFREEKVPAGADIFPIADEMPPDQQEWTGSSPRIVPSGWKGSGVIISKICDGDDTMLDGLTERGDRVLIKAFDPAAFRPGGRLAAYKRGAAVYESATGREKGIKLQKTGLLVVESVKGNRVTARVVVSGSSVDKGQLVAQ